MRHASPSSRAHGGGGACAHARGTRRRRGHRPHHPAGPFSRHTPSGSGAGPRALQREEAYSSTRPSERGAVSQQHRGAGKASERGLLVLWASWGPWEGCPLPQPPQQPARRARRVPRSFPSTAKPSRRTDRRKALCSGPGGTAGPL